MNSKQDSSAQVIAEKILAVLEKVPEETASQAVLLALLTVTCAVLESCCEDLPAATAHFWSLFQELDRHIQAGMEWQREYCGEKVQEVIQ